MIILYSECVGTVSFWYSSFPSLSDTHNITPHTNQIITLIKWKFSRFITYLKENAWSASELVYTFVYNHISRHEKWSYVWNWTYMYVNLSVRVRSVAQLTTTNHIQRVICVYEHFLWRHIKSLWIVFNLNTEATVFPTGQQT